MSVALAPANHLALLACMDAQFIPKTDKVRGFVSDVATGKLHEVEAAA